MNFILRNMLSRYTLFAAVYGVAAAVSLVFWSGGAVQMILLLLHAGFGAAVCAGVRNQRVYLAVGELLLAAVVLLAGFRWFYAANANLDYVQRIMEHSGNVSFELNSRSERVRVLAQYLPLIIAGLVFMVTRIRMLPRGLVAAYGSARAAVWFPLFICASAAAAAFSLPSFLSLNGVPLLAWAAYIPLFILLDRLPFATAWRWGLVWGMLSLLLTNYWLSTFSLISLQTVVLIYSVYYLMYIPVVLGLRAIGGRWRFLLMAVSLALFDYFRSIGFLGYPWGLIAHSQYQNTLLMQSAELFGVWGVGLVIFLVNGAAAQTLSLLFDRRHVRAAPGRRELAAALPALLPAVFLLFAVLVFGAVRLQAGHAGEAASGDRSARIALIQQNTDPRKANFYYTLGQLRELTAQALQHKPDLVVWPETAIVPSIRVWSQSDDPWGTYTDYIQRFRGFQKNIETPLLLGNDDYEILRDAEGNEIERLHYNAAVFLDAHGELQNVYHKIRLVPFTEYFPMGEYFPAAQEILESYGVDLWEPGHAYTVFDGPGFSLAAPICFEDIFPDTVRRFVAAGADVIINLTNDYWSLDPVQAQQHYAASVFRAVENRRPLLRSTVSGRTAQVDRFGRQQGELPMFERGYLIADVETGTSTRTLYTVWGDWLPRVLLWALLGIALLWAVRTGSDYRRR